MWKSSNKVKFRFEIGFSLEFWIYLRGQWVQYSGLSIYRGPILQNITPSRKVLREKLITALNPQKTPHTSPWRASYGESFVSFCKKIDREISRVHCITHSDTLIHSSYGSMWLDIRHYCSMSSIHTVPRCVGWHCQTQSPCPSGCFHRRQRRSNPHRHRLEMNISYICVIEAGQHWPMLSLVSSRQVITRTNDDKRSYASRWVSWEKFAFENYILHKFGTSLRGQWVNNLDSIHQRCSDPDWGPCYHWATYVCYSYHQKRCWSQ